MKKKFKDKIFIPMLVIFIFMGFITSIIGCMQYKENQTNLIERHKQLTADCKKENQEDSSEEKIEWCKKILLSDLSEYDTNTSDAYEMYVLEDLRIFFGEFIIIAVVISGSSYYITKYLKNRIILNDITRENYKKIIKKLFLLAWKYALLIPAMLITIFITISLFVDHFQVSSDMLRFSSFDGIFQNNLLLYLLSILIQSCILSLIYINVNLIVSRKEHNYILSVITSYIFIIGIEIFLEATIVNLFGKFNFGIGHLFNILNLYTNPYGEYNFGYVFILFGILLISFIPLFFVYKNKEKLIIDSEKNNNKEEV